MNEEPLFKTEFKLTYEEYKKFNLAMIDKKTKVFIVIARIIYAIVAIEAIILLISFLFIRDIYLLLVAMFTAVIAILAFGRYKLPSERFMKKVYYSDKGRVDLISEIRFYEDHLEDESEIGIIKLKYDDIYGIVETKTNFYIKQSSVLGILIDKSACSPELIEFITSLKK